MKKALALMLALTLALALLAGCADGGTPGATTTAATTTAATTTAATTTAGTSATTTTGATTTPPKAEEYTIRIAWWGTQIRHDATLAVLQLYHDQNPNITIEPEFTGWDGYWDKIATLAAANTLPHVWQQSIAYLKQYVDADRLTDLQPYADNGTIDLSDWTQAAVEIGRLSDGGLWALTLGNTAHALCYNPELFQKAGIPEPTGDWTWDEYIETMRKVKETLNIWGDGNYTNMNQTDGLRHYVFSLGYTFYSADQKSLGFSKEQAVDWLTREYNAVKEGLVADVATQGEITTPEQSLLVTGEAAMVGSNNSNTTVALMTAAGKEFKLVNYPHADGEVRWGTVLGPSMLINVSNTGSDAEKTEAAKLVNFILNDLDANKILLGERGVPGSTVVAEAILPLLSPYVRVTFDYVNSVAPNLQPNPEVIMPPAAGEVMNLYKRIHDSIMFDQLGIQEGVDQFFTEANALLAK